MYNNFYRLLQKHNVSVADVCRATGISQSTMSNWKSRDTAISIKNAQLIADYFGITVDQLMFGKDTAKESQSGKTYYFSDETAETAQEILEDRNLRMLFDAAKGSKPEDLQMATDMLRRFKETNPDG